jgi:serine/threonine protein kinase
MAERKMNVEAMTRHHPSIYVGFNIVFSRLKKGELLGKGGFGNVYQATYFGQDVAVKEIHDEAASKLTGDAMEDIEHECQLHYNLRHDNVVELLCFNTSPDLGPISLVMRRMAASCFDMLHSRVIPTPLAYLFSPTLGPMDRELHGGVAPPPSPLPLRTRVRMLLDAARGMAFLHGNGVLHLDVKSMNLMLTPR